MTSSLVLDKRIFFLFSESGQVEKVTIEHMRKPTEKIYMNLDSNIKRISLNCVTEEKKGKK